MTSILRRLRSFLGFLSPTRGGRCVAAMLEMGELGRLAGGTDAAHFSIFLRRAADAADRLARLSRGRASAVEAGTFLACFPCEGAPSPASDAVSWALALRHELEGLAASVAGAALPPRFAAGIACGRGFFGRRSGDPAVAGEPARRAGFLLAAARACDGVFVDDEAAASLSARCRFEDVPAQAEGQAFTARKLVL